MAYVSSVQLSAQACDLVCVALRHIRDAEYLANLDGRHPPHADGSPAYTSLDQAYHLAGFGPECIRKAVLSIRDFDKEIGHRFNEPAAAPVTTTNEDVIDVIIAMDPGAHRYYPVDAPWASRYPALRAWTEEARYRRTGTYANDPARVRALLVEAREAIDEVVLSLWLDGRLPESEIGR